MKHIVLHIDRLVLRGVERSDAAALTAALRQALQQGLADPAVAQALATQASTAQLRAAPVVLAPGAGTGARGRAVGQAIVRQLGRGASS